MTRRGCGPATATTSATGSPTSSPPPRGSCRTVSCSTALSEVILGADGRLSFDALQQRLVTSPARARAKAAELPASFAAFDLLAANGIDLRTQRWTVRRQRLEQLGALSGLTKRPARAVPA